MATFYAKGKVDLTIIIDTFWECKSLEKVCLTCLVFILVLFMSLEVMFTMTTMVSKIHYTKSLFQILMGSIRTSR